MPVSKALLAESALTFALLLHTSLPYAERKPAPPSVETHGPPSSPVGQKAHTTLAVTGSIVPPRSAEQGVGSWSKLAPSSSDRQSPVPPRSQTSAPWTPRDGGGSPSSLRGSGLAHWP